jgi:hypothetical protein
MTTAIADYFNFTRLPQFLNMPSTCTYESYTGGVGCKFTVNEPVSYTNFHVAIDSCPNSYVPYVSASCEGPWCSYLFRPCVDASRSSDCGNSGLKCRNFELESDTRSNGFINILLNASLIRDKAEMDAACATTETGTAIFARRMRTKMFELFNLSTPGDVTPAQREGDLFFCLPSDSSWKNIQAEATNALNDVIETDLTTDPTVGRTTAECVATGCDPLVVGDGTCQLMCFSEECKWDGGDCGGAPVDDIAKTYIDDTLKNDRCTIQPGQVNYPTESWKNVWERCNGIGNCLEASGVCQCTCTIHAGLPPGVEGNQCENCDPKRTCQAPITPGTCVYYGRQLQGVQDRLRAWNGDLSDGTNVFDVDRKSGLNYTTPAAIFETETALNANQRTIFQFTCAGEIGVTLGNGFLQFGMHAPWLQDVSSFLATTINDLAQCRMGQYGVNAKLSKSQIETRFMVHHPAFWFYQFFYLGYYLNPALETNTNTNGGTKFFGGRNTLFDIYPDETNPLGFGKWDLVDPLMYPGLRREPKQSPTPAASPWYIQSTDWAKQFRMFSPAAEQTDVGDSPSDCSYFTATDFPDEANPATWNRRCKLTYNRFGSLFSSRGANLPQVHNIHLDVRLDSVCDNAATGQRLPGASPSRILPGTSAAPTPFMTTAQARMAFPAISIVYEGVGASIADNPVPCATDADCNVGRGYPADSAYCVDLDDDLLDVAGIYKGRNIDPLGRFIYGMYNVDRVKNNVGINPDICSSTLAVDTTIRQLLNSIAGRPRDLSSSSKFCFMKPDILANNYRAGWQDSSFEKGTCDLTRDYFDPNRICLNTLPSASPVSGIGRGWNPAKPYRVRGWSGQPVQSLVVPPRQSGIMPFQPNARAWGSFGGLGARLPAADPKTFLQLSLPFYTAATVTNNVREKIRWSLATSLSQFGFAVTPNNIWISSIEDNPLAFKPLQDNSRAGITVNWWADIPNGAAAGNITAQLRSKSAGTLGARAGTFLAQSGLVPWRYQSEVEFNARFPPIIVEEGLSGGAIFAIILFVFTIVGFGVYFARGGTVAGIVSAVSSAVAYLTHLGRTVAPRKAASKSGPRKAGGVGEVVAEQPFPERKNSRIETMNPIMGAEDGGHVGAGAGPGIAMNAMRVEQQQQSTTMMSAPGSASAAPAPAAAAMMLPTQMYVRPSEAAYQPVPVGAHPMATPGMPAAAAPPMAPRA